ncbi:MAG: ATP-binding protein [Clostridiales bacterium]|nr:ATP-binding protein [Clostridiales bacterium]
MEFTVTRGPIPRGQKVVIYGPEGIGKTTFAARFPDPLYIDTEGSTSHFDVARLPAPESWAMLFEECVHVADNPALCKTLVIDTADWAEKLCIQSVCIRAGKNGIEEFGYGNGYTYVCEEFGKLLNYLEDAIIRQGLNVVFCAHAALRKVELPDEMGRYDKWALKLIDAQKCSVAAMLKEWADLLLFCNYKTIVVRDENGKGKAQGGKRMMYAAHHTCWDAKNRHGLPDEMPMEYEQIAHLFTPASAPAAPTPQPEPAPEPQPAPAPVPAPQPSQPEPLQGEDDPLTGIHPRLAELKRSRNVTPREIQLVVGERGYFPEDMPVGDYPADFVEGCLVGCWPQVWQMIDDNRNMPFQI